MKESEEKTRAVIESSPFPIGVYIGKELKIEFANQSILDIWGKGNDVIGKSFKDILPELANQKIFEQLDEVFNIGIPLHVKNQKINLVIAGNLQPYYFNYSFTPLYNSSGKVYGVMNTAADVTDLNLAIQKAEQSEEQFSTLADNMENLAWTAEGDGTIYWYNRRWYEYTGTTLEEMYGWGWAKVHHPDHVERVLEFVKKAWLVNKPFELTFPLRSADGIYKWFLTRAYPIVNDDGKIIRWIGTNTDIDEQKRAEDEFRLLADQAPMWVWLIDKEVNTLYANTELLNFVGLKEASEFTGRIWEQKVHPEDIQLVYKTFEEATALKKSFAIEYRIQNAATLNYEWVFSKGVPRYEENEFTGFIGTGVNINEQKNAFSQVAYRKALLEAHHEASVDGILLVDTKGKILSYNHRFVEIWDMPRQIVDDKDDEAALSFALTQVVNPEHFIEKVKWLYEHPDETSLDELEFLNGKIVQRYGYPVKTPEGGYYAWSWIFRDISEQRKSENIIKESERQLRQTTEHFKLATTSAEVGTWSLDLASETLEWSDLHKKMWGYDENKSGLKYEDWHTVILSEDKEGAFSNVAKALKTKTLYEATYRIKRADTKEVRWIRSTGQYRYDESGKPFTLTGVSLDITNEKNAELALKESEKRFRTLADFMPQKIWITDNKGTVTYLNQQYLKFTGLTIEKFNETVWKDFFHPDDRAETSKRFSNSLASGNDYEMETRIKDKDGNYLWHLNRATPFKDEHGNIQMWIGSDTEIQKTKDEQKRRDDFIKIVSHELKTPVTSIKGYVQFMTMMMESEKASYPAQFISSLSRIDSQVLRLTKLITEMLDLSRIETGKLELQMETFSINELTAEVVQDIRHTHPGHDLNLVFDYKAIITGDRDRIGQVLINFINNAIKYSPGKDKVEVSVKKGSKGFVSVSVKDYGIGISKEEHEKIFERFYRAEGDNENTFEGFGIGLFIANDIIKKHHGSITVKSELDKGSEFSFHLPILQ